MKRLVVVGDVLLDRDIMGTVDRLCPDAPVPVVDEDRVIERPGGAGLAALLAARGDIEVILLAAIGEDPAGRIVRRLLAESAVTVPRWRDPAATAEKERVHVRGRPLVRLDRGGGGRELPTPPPSAVASLDAADAVLVADYGRGVAADNAIRDALARAVRRNVPVVWDPHPKGATPIPGVALVTPNTAELTHFDATSNPAATPPTALEQVVAGARRLRVTWRAAALAVTRGAAGAVLVTQDDGAPLVVPVDVAATDHCDTCGAGDAFAAACSVAFATGAVASEAVHRGVLVASRFVGDGAALGMTEAAHLGARGSAHSPGRPGVDERGTVVATGGCFDLLHAGHVATLQRARMLGDRLVVLLNGDASIRRLKGPGRPLQPAADRAAVLRSLSCVDDVIVFDDDTPVRALRTLRPQIFVKGGDYAGAELPETHVMAKWGGLVVTVPYLAGRSTTELVSLMAAGHVG